MVKCANCGFLALRKFEVEGLLEADANYRETGERKPVEAPHWNVPICFMRAADLRGEREHPPRMGVVIYEEDPYKGWPSEGEQNLAVITQERVCDSFTEWQQGFTPKEHREIMDRREWREWQERQRRDDKRWRIIELIVFGVIAVLVAGGFIVLGAFIERGSIP